MSQHNATLRYEASIPAGKTVEIAPLTNPPVIANGGECIHYTKAIKLDIHSGDNLLLRGRRVGGRDQMPSGGLPAFVFSSTASIPWSNDMPGAVGSEMQFDMATPGEKISLVVENVGNEVAAFVAEITAMVSE